MEIELKEAYHCEVKKIDNKVLNELWLYFQQMNDTMQMHTIENLKDRLFYNNIVIDTDSLDYSVLHNCLKHSLDRIGRYQDKIYPTRRSCWAYKIDIDLLIYKLCCEYEEKGVI